MLFILDFLDAIGHVWYVTIPVGWVNHLLIFCWIDIKKYYSFRQLYQFFLKHLTSWLTDCYQQIDRPTIWMTNWPAKRSANRSQTNRRSAEDRLTDWLVNTNCDISKKSWLGKFYHNIVTKCFILFYKNYKYICRLEGININVFLKDFV